MRVVSLSMLALRHVVSERWCWGRFATVGLHQWLQAVKALLADVVEGWSGASFPPGFLSLQYRLSTMLRMLFFEII